jgi:hypothetical protein
MLGPETCDPKTYRPVFYPNASAKMWRGVLLVFALIHLVLSVMLCVVELQRGVFELIAVLVLCCAMCRMDYCCLIQYDVFCLIDFFQYINIVGLYLQNGTLDEKLQPNQGERGEQSKYNLVVMICLCVYYAVVIIVSFFVYRVWKGQLHDLAIGKGLDYETGAAVGGAASGNARGGGNFSNAGGAGRGIQMGNRPA